VVLVSLKLSHEWEHSRSSTKVDEMEQKSLFLGHFDQKGCLMMDGNDF